ncbi:hypothetical protein [Hydrogenovibrio kuenenii]
MVKVSEAPKVSQPNALAGGTTQVTPSSQLSIQKLGNKSNDEVSKRRYVG